jgi:hypothetical protein
VNRVLVWDSRVVLGTIAGDPESGGAGGLVVASPIYRKDAWSVEQAIATLRDGAGSHFDPSVIEAFESCLPRILEIKAAWDQRETLA